MKRFYVKRTTARKMLCLLLCVAITVTGLPLNLKAADTDTKTKFVKAEPQIFVPSEGEKADITFNLENRHPVNIYIKDGKKVIATLAENKVYKGGYVPHRIVWDGKDQNGNSVSSGTYKVIIEPADKYKKYKSITSVTVISGNTQEIYIAPNIQSNEYKVYGKGGKNQGIKNVTLSCTKDGTEETVKNAVIQDNLWYAKVTMSAYSFYDLKATIQKKSGTATGHILAAMHTFRITDRLEYLASAYYGDYKKDSAIRKDNGIYETYKNSGELVGKNLLIINPSLVVKPKPKSDNTEVSQHLGIIDQLQQIASMNPASLTLGNNVYETEDLHLDGAMPLTLSRTYNSRSTSFHEFGINWSDSCTFFLQDMGNAITIRMEDGHMEYYTRKGDGSYEKPEGLARELKANTDGTYTLTMDGTSIYEFAGNGKLKEIRDLNGNAIQYSYTDGLLTKVESISGFLTFHYQKDGRIKSIKDSGNREIQYSYANGLLTSFTDAKGNKTAYAYDAENRLNKVVSPEKVVLYQTEYDSQNRVTSQTIQGSTYTYRYDDKKRIIACTEPNGNTMKFHYTEDYRIESEEYADGTITYYYDEKSNKTKAKPASLGLGKNVKLLETKPGILELKTYNRNTCTGDQENNTLYPQFHITNTSKKKIELEDLTLRYYFTIDGERALNFFCDHAAVCDSNKISISSLTGKFIKLDNPVKGVDCYMEIGFQKEAGNLESNQYIDFHTRIGKDNWTIFKPGDDYSQNLAPRLSCFDGVDVFYKGNLVWGKGEIDGTGTLIKSQKTSHTGNTSNRQADQSIRENHPDVYTGSYEEDMVPKGINRLKLKMYNAENGNTCGTTIHPMMKVVNLGENMTALKDVTIRYYYTADGEEPQNFWCDWSEIGAGNVTGTFHKLDKPYEGADTCLEIGFSKEAGYLDIGGAVTLHVRAAKKDWSSYDLTNDYSANSGHAYIDWKKAEVYVDGVKVWGEDCPEEEEKAESEQMDYADDTCTPVRVQMYNRSRKNRSNEISPKFRLYNTSEEPIRLSDLRLNYFYTADGPENQIFEPDWAGIGNEFQSIIDRKEITCQFTEVNETNLETKCIADIGFARDDRSIQPGEYLELHVRIHRENWTDYVQANDFSMNPDSIDYEDWNQIAVFLKDRWVYGRIPLSLAESIDPDPQEDEEPQYLSLSRESYTRSTDKAGNETEYKYDANGNLLSTTDALGNVTVNTYNERGQITSTTDALGSTTTYTYDKNGNQTKETDALGNVTTYIYNKKGWLTKTVMPDGTTETRTYDARGNNKTITDGIGNTVTYKYNALNQTTSITDANGGTTKYAYDKNGNLTKTTDALGFTEKTAYNKDGKVTKETDKNGNVTAYIYNKTTGYQSQMIRASGGKETYAYDKMGNQTRITAPDGGITRYTYDALGRLESETDANGGKKTYAYDKNGNILKETDELGNATTYTYDKLGQVLTKTDASGSTATYTYDALGRTLTETDGNGGVTKYVYDKLGRLIKTIDANKAVTKTAYNKAGLESSETDALGYKISFQYDKAGRKIKETDALGNSTRWQYDQNGNITNVTDANGNTTAYTYDKENQILTATDANGSTITYTYDGNGNVLTETDASGNSTTYQYDAMGNQTAITNALGKTVKNEYNTSGLLISTTDASGNSTTYAYDKNGNVTSTTDSLGATTTCTYDKADQLLTKTDALGGKTSYIYDKRGNVWQKTDANGNRTKYAYNKANNLTKVTDALGAVTAYTYDKKGNLTKQVQKGNSSSEDQITAYAYDKNGQLTKVTDAEGRTITYAYDAEGRLIKETGKDEKTTIYQYDKAGNLLKTIYPDGKTVSWTYTATDQPKTMTDWNGTTTYEYDKNGNLIKAIDAKKQTIQYTWTKLGQKKTITYPDKTKVQYTYDAKGNITKTADTQKGITTYTYDAENHLKTKKLPNGAKSTYTYDKNGQLTKRVESGTGNQETYHYAYDKNGNRIQETRISEGTTETAHYTYDALDQLTGATDRNGTRTYVFDVFHNRIQKKETGKDTIWYTYNRLNELIETRQGSDHVTYAYDSRGNQTEVRENGEVKKTYTFDFAGKMSKAVIRQKDKTITDQYTYDGEGNRIQTKTETNGKTTGNTVYAVDWESSCHNIIQAKDTISGKTSVFTFARDEAVSVEIGGKISYYRTDEKHSVTEILSSTGKSGATIAYDEYGNPEYPEAVNTSGNLFGYTGHAYEETTGLYYAKARYYDAENGRFLSVDCYQGDTQNPASLNSYIYVQNNPHKYIDPSGHIAVATIAKMGTGALFDMGMQIVANYFFNSKTAGNFKESFSKVNWWQATRSGVESLFHFKSKTLTAAITGFGDVIINWMKQGKKYSCEKALKDFAVGFLSDLAARYVCKFGAKAVAKGMDKMGVSHARIKKLTGIDLSGGRKVAKITRNKSVRRVTISNGVSIKESGKAGFENWLNKGAANNKVYFGIKGGKAVYTGITKQTIDLRLYQHNKNGKGFSRLRIQHSNLTRNQARAIEQYYIEHGPNKMNKINSIGKNNKYYKDAMKWAKKYLGVK
ncbi:cellulose binding domain-containing protein [[Clostridium] polysaccharolyticum]|uniref:RHS repeat-associated core domain-containing protein n=1 Tax=[Clostridium] polysaccharolyticum TaxID=29364 RepID=A0A1I0FCP6_9FIRM|nr:cellulose binding domain-containing protein [[Clostridium] polysaccharolyticum]SET55925.1 RHS repeat-associated core domain-containing protein [[Clostridium] polysaccharolyticum]